MPQSLSQRLLSVLQLTRMALVFTAIADSFCTVLLAARLRAGTEHPGSVRLDALHLLIVAAISVGLYGFGMSLNDIIDRRRDSQIAAHRPLPSGRVGLLTAHAVCAFLILMALIAGAIYSATTHDWRSFVLVLCTGMLISFYDLAGKYLVALGLITLGLIRFFHALIPSPYVPLIWHPLLLLNHVTILSAVAYRWEEKRPPLTRIHWWTLLGGLGAVDAISIAALATARMRSRGVGMLEALDVRPELALPFAAAALYALIAWYFRRASPDPRSAGQKAMLYGLLWLIVYDACFVAAYVDLLDAALLLLLLPIAYFSVQLMRWWSKLVTLSQRPNFKRART